MAILTSLFLFSYSQRGPEILLFLKNLEAIGFPAKQRSLLCFLSHPQLWLAIQIPISESGWCVCHKSWDRLEKKEYLIILYWIKSLKFLTITLINWYSRMTFSMLLSSPQLIQHTPPLFLVRKCLSRGIAGRTHYSLIKVNCIVYAMNPATCCNVSYVATQLAKMGQTL